MALVENTSLDFQYFVVHNITVMFIAQWTLIIRDLGTSYIIVCTILTKYWFIFARTIERTWFLEIIFMYT